MHHKSCHTTAIEPRDDHTHSHGRLSVRPVSPNQCTCSCPCPSPLSRRVPTRRWRVCRLSLSCCWLRPGARPQSQHKQKCTESIQLQHQTCDFEKRAPDVNTNKHVRKSLQPKNQPCGFEKSAPDVNTNKHARKSLQLQNQTCDFEQCERDGRTHPIARQNMHGNVHVHPKKQSIERLRPTTHGRQRRTYTTLELTKKMPHDRPETLRKRTTRDEHCHTP